MRLLNTKTYRLHSFMDQNIPRYAILSHRWGEREVIFAELRDCGMVDDGFSGSAEEERLFPYLGELRQHRISTLRSRQSWPKIERFCKKARAYSLDWAWIDTACIDKSSSAELQEAINSMYEWYLRAEKCFVYMNDVAASDNPDIRGAQFLASEWFKRGWTLQELIAPNFGKRIFLDRDWEHIGLDADLIDEISRATTIPLKILSATNRSSKKILLYGCSVAQRMSWAANRQVSRGEDTAYSLLGLFEVNMPLLYGEGQAKAFERLQLEILKESTDESILAWQHDDDTWHLFMEYSFAALASSPEVFKHTTNFESLSTMESPMRSKGIRNTPRGLLMRAVLINRHEESAITNAFLSVKEWTTTFAFPLRVRAPREQGQCKEIVFVQLEHWAADEYVREGSLFLADVDLGKLAMQKAPEKFCIRSGKSITRTGYGQV